jgi:hypothetical protein
MRLHRLLAVLAVAGTAALAPVIVGGAAATPPSDHWTVTLEATPNPVDAGATLTLSGVLLNNGWQGVGNQQVVISEFSNSECSGASTPIVTATTENGLWTKGHYSRDIAVGDDAEGDYYLQAEATGHGLGKHAVSGCVVLTVKGSGNDEGGNDEEGGGTLAPAAAPVSSGPDRYGYCSVQGNSLPDGTPLAPGTFLNLLLDQPSADEHYTGATPAYWMEGVGITCDLPPAQAASVSSTPPLVNHVGATNTEQGPLFYQFVPKA